MLIALLRALSQMKSILDEEDRGSLKDLVLMSRMHPRVLSIGIRLAILDHDTQFESPEQDEANLDKRRDIMTELIGLTRATGAAGAAGRAGASTDGEEDYEDDFEGDDDDMMMPDEDAVRDDDADDADVDGAGPYGDAASDSDSNFDPESDPRLVELSRTVAEQKSLLQKKMDFVKEQLSMLQDLKKSCQEKLSEAMEGVDEGDEGEGDEDTDTEGMDSDMAYDMDDAPAASSPSRVRAA